MTAAGDFIIARFNVYQRPIKPAASSCVVVVVVVGGVVVMRSGAFTAALLTRFQLRGRVRASSCGDAEPSLAKLFKKVARSVKIKLYRRFEAKAGAFKKQRENVSHFLRPSLITHFLIIFYYIWVVLFKPTTFAVTKSRKAT